MGNVLIGLFSMIGSGLRAFFGFKEHQSKVIESALNVIGDVNASESQREQAIAIIISSEAKSDYWLAAIWRPLTMIVFLILIVAFWFGYTPPHLEKPMPPILDRLFDLLQMGLGGYIGGRSLEKIFQSLGMSSVLKTFIQKKLS